MGLAKQLGQFRRAEKAKSRAYKLSRELQRFYASHLVSKWQREKIQEVRNIHEYKQKGLAMAHDIAASQLSEEFMQFELDYLYASEQFKKDNPGKEWTPDGVKGIFSKAFWRNMIKKGKGVGVTFNNGQEKAGAK